MAPPHDHSSRRRRQRSSPGPDRSSPGPDRSWPAGDRSSPAGDRRSPRRRAGLVWRRTGALGLLVIALAFGAVWAGKAAPAHRHASQRRFAAHRAAPYSAAGHASAEAGHATGGAGHATAEAGHATAIEASETPEIGKLIALGRPIYCGGPHGNEVALTFDDGPGEYTYLAVPKLRRAGIKGTFFIVGRNIPLRPRAIREERMLGSVGDHTFTHPLLTGMAPSTAEAEIVRTQRAIQRASGGPVFLFRPPYGARNAEIDAIARKHGLLEIMWTVDSADSLGANYLGIERNVIGGLRPGAIILMHENHGQTIRAMPAIFAAIRRKHLSTVSVARLLTDDAPSEAQIRAGGAGCGALFGPRSGG